MDGKLKRLAMLGFVILLLLSFVIAAIPESPDTLYACCKSNVQLPGYRAVYGVDVADMDTHCEEKYDR